VFRTVQGDLEHDVRRHRWTAAASAVAVLAACSSAPSEDAERAATDAPATPAPQEATPEPPPTSPQGEDAALLAFTGRQLDGGTFDGAAVTGDVVVWFWTPW
jgi:hypothetical protein